MAELILLSGPPGAGKSTVARLLAHAEPGGALSTCAGPTALLAGDDVFGFLARGALPPWKPEAHRQNEAVTRAAAAAAGHFAAGGIHTVYDGVVGPWFLDTFADAAGLPELQYVVLLPLVEDCLERVRTRGDHEFDDPDATRHMHRQFTGSTVDPRHVLTDPGDGPESVAVSVAGGVREGLFRYRAKGGAQGDARPKVSARGRRSR